MTREQFEQVAAWFRQRGHTVHSEDNTLLVTGRMIRAVLAWSENPAGTDNILFADNARCFDKPAKCPIAVRLDGIVFESIVDELDKNLHFLASRRGYRWSNTYEYLSAPIIWRGR